MMSWAASSTSSNPGLNNNMNMQTRPIRSSRRCRNLCRSMLPVIAFLVSHQTSVNALLATTQTLKVCARNLNQCELQRRVQMFCGRNSPLVTYLPLFQPMSKFRYGNENTRKRCARIVSFSSNTDDDPEQSSRGDKSNPSKSYDVNRSKANKASSNDDVQSGGRSTAKGAVPKALDDKKNSAKKQRRRNNYKTNGKYGRRRQRQLPEAKAQSNSESDDSSSKLGVKTSKNLAPPASTIPGKISTRFSNTGLKEFTSASHQETQQDNSDAISDMTTDMLKKRVVQLETLVSSQASELQKLRREINAITKSVGAFSNVVELLQEAGLDIMASNMEELGDGDDSNNNLRSRSGLPREGMVPQSTSFEDDMEIFGIAPTTVTDAADAAGSSILSAILAGKQRMLVDVRDAELTRDPALFAEFIELAILPVAAGLEGLDGDEYIRNRVKIVFPTVKEMMAYRKSMTLAAPEVVALSTLGLDPVEERDNLIVIVAPSPDDIPACTLMQKLLERTDTAFVEPDLRILQPLVIINHHMMPIDTGKVGKFTVAYHLRLLSVQYMTGDNVPEYIGEVEGEEKGKKEDQSDTDEDESALEAAMTHARETGVHQGVTRAMVIRQYPKPWHVFVDTSPDTDADFEVAATFDSEPSQEDVNYSIVECLEGSEREDELVAQQMQAALDAGQLTRVSEMLGISASSLAESVGVFSSDVSGSEVRALDKTNSSKVEERIEWDDLFYDDWLNEDSV